jgi:hypothetical protein
MTIYWAVYWCSRGQLITKSAVAVRSFPVFEANQADLPWLFNAAKLRSVQGHLSRPLSSLQSAGWMFAAFSSNFSWIMVRTLLCSSCDHQRTLPRC